MSFLPPRLATLALCLALLPRAAAQTVEFAAASYDVNEREDQLVVRVVTEGLVVGGSATIKVAGGTAKPGEDFYWPTSDQVLHTWEQFFLFHDLNDGLPEGDETVVLELVDPSPGLRIGAINRTTITIHNDNEPTLVQSRNWPTRGNEPIGSATRLVSLVRRGDPNIAFTVEFYAHTNSMAKAGTDFRLPAPIRFAPGEWDKNVELTLLEDADCEGDETAIVEMRSPDLGGRVLGTFQFEIEENFTPATVDFRYLPELMPWGNYPSRGPWEHIDGTRLVCDEGGNVCRYGLRRFLSDGSVDDTFKPPHDGCVASPHILVQPDGRIICVSEWLNESGDYVHGIVRLLPNGGRDPSFATPSLGYRADLVGLAKNGDIIALGYVADYAVLQLLAPDGTPRPKHQTAYIYYYGAGKECILIFPRNPDVIRLSCSTRLRDFGDVAVRLENAPRSGFRPFSLCSSAIGWLCEFFPLRGGWEAVAQVGDKTVELDIRRLGEVSGSASVRYATRDGTAKAGTDYAALTGRLDFAPCEKVKHISIPLLDTPEVARQFTLELSEAQGAVVLGPPFPILIRGRQRSFVPEALAVGPDGDCLLTFDLKPNENPREFFTVEVSTNLTDWEVVGGGNVGDFSSGLARMDFGSGGYTQRFYRVRRN